MIYEITLGFPSDEKFGLISQMRRAALSILSNIAEGTGRHSYKDKARYTEIAYSSELKLLNQAIPSFDLGLVSEADFIKTRESISPITAMLDDLPKSQQKRILYDA